MQIHEINYDYANKIVTVTWEDGTKTAYAEADKEQYLADTGRVNDVAAIGWA